MMEAVVETTEWSGDVQLVTTVNRLGLTKILAYIKQGSTDPTI
jgi:hypothetical protein